MKIFKTSTLILIFTALLSAYIYSLSIGNLGYWWDEAVYLDLAKNIFTNHVYGINFLHPEQLQQNYRYIADFDESFRPPLFPLLLSFLFPLGEDAERLLPIMFYFLSVIVTYFFAKKLFNEKIAIVSSLFVATSALYIFFSSKVLTESLSLLLFTSSLYSFYKSFEDDRFFTLTSFLTALAILTHYTNALLHIIYIFFVAFTECRKKFYKILRSKNFLLALVIFFLTLSPWLYFSYARYGTIFGALQVAYSDVQKPYFQEPWYFYLQNVFSIFGLPIIFIVPAVVARKKFVGRKKFDNGWKLVAISALIVFSIFSVLERKELRYLVPYSSVFFILCAVGFYNLEKLLNRKFFMLVPIVFALSPLLSGLTMVQVDFQAGAAVKGAAYFLKQFPDSYVVAENYPIINLISGKSVIPFPWTVESFNNILKNFSIRFVVVDQSELYQSPAYVSQIENNSNFSLLAEFDSQVRIYETTNSK